MTNQDCNNQNTARRKANNNLILIGSKRHRDVCKQAFHIKRNHHLSFKYLSFIPLNYC